jgi:nitrogenase molybdenum-iron protein alpha chain
MMKAKYGIDWLKVNFIGVGATIRSLRDIAKYFGDPELTARTEEVIKDELASIFDDVEYYKSKLKGKKAGIFVGGSRSHHYQALLRDFGVETIIAGYEFAHRDDYEGREVIPTIKEDADSKNIENARHRTRSGAVTDRNHVGRDRGYPQGYPGWTRTRA